VKLAWLDTIQLAELETQHGVLFATCSQRHGTARCVCRAISRPADASGMWVEP
jgi:hypothetical protein